MRNYSVIALMTVVWLVLMANIIWSRTDGQWKVEDADKIALIEVAKYTNQIIVVAVSDEGARLCFYERMPVNEDGKMKEEERNKIEKRCDRDDRASRKDKWKLILETEAIIGKNGLGKTKEGDGKTPVGVFRFTNVFGILDNPGSKMKYTKVDERHYWVDDSISKYYNQFISTGTMNQDWESAEHICEYEESYHYVLATSYNSECIPGAGSAVFLHCTSEDSKATEGCIAVPEVYMKELVKRVESQCVLIVDEERNILRY